MSFIYFTCRIWLRDAVTPELPFYVMLQMVYKCVAGNLESLGDVSINSMVCLKKLMMCLDSFYYPVSVQ